MLRILSLSLLLLLINCSKLKEETNKKSVGNETLLLSVSATQLDFIDFPLWIDAMELIDRKGESVSLVRNKTLNLTNLGESTYLIARKEGDFHKEFQTLRLELQFTEASDVIFYSPLQNKRYIKKLLTEDGKVLGVDQKKLTVEIPVNALDNAFYPRKNETRHLSVNFNLQNMITVRESEEDVLLVFSPLPQVNELPLTNSLSLKGKISEVDVSAIQVTTGFDESFIPVSTDLAKRTRLDNQKVERNSVSLVAGQNVSALVSIDGKGKIVAEDLNVFSSRIKIFKGSATDIGEENVTFLGNAYSAYDFLARKNYYLTINSRHLPLPITGIKLKMPLTVDISDVEIDQDEAGTTLRGADNFIVTHVPAIPEEDVSENTPEVPNADDAANTDSSDAGDILPESGTTDTPENPDVVVEEGEEDRTLVVVENEPDELYFHYNEETRQRYEAEFGPIAEAENLNLVYVTAMSVNGQSLEVADPYILHYADTDNPVSTGFYRASGYFRQHPAADIQYFHPEVVFKVTANEESPLHYFDMTEIQLLRDEGRLSTEAWHFNWPQLITDDGTGQVSFTETLLVKDPESGNFERICETLDMNFNQESDVDPKISVGYLTKGPNGLDNLLSHFDSVSEMKAWVNVLTTEIYVKAVDISGEFSEESDTGICQFNADYLDLVFVSDKTLLDNGETLPGSEGLGRKDRAIIIGVGAATAAIGVVAILYLVNKLFEDKLKKGRSFSEGSGSDGGNTDTSRTPRDFDDPIYSDIVTESKNISQDGPRYGFDVAVPAAADDISDLYATALQKNPVYEDDLDEGSRKSGVNQVDTDGTPDFNADEFLNSRERQTTVPDADSETFDRVRTNSVPSNSRNPGSTPLVPRRSTR